MKTSAKASTQASATRYLALLDQLRASLRCSHRAMVALDLAGIEQGTREQLVLSRKLAEEIRQARMAGRLSGNDSELSRELRQSEWKVLEAARVQAGLLKRGRHKLVVMANMLAGPNRNYESSLAGGARRWR